MLLLVAFGAIPLAAAIAIGYTVSRSVIMRQAQSALRELTRQQAVHIATELTREQLILRTITGHVGPLPDTDLSAAMVADRLQQSLPEGGVFDGLRLVRRDGAILASVALRNVAPHWPSEAPAADWTDRRVVVHWEGERALAYLLAAPLTSTSEVWLEGHVRAEDFGRLFAIPTHLMGDVESAVLHGDGRLILVTHEHAGPDLRKILSGASGTGSLADTTVRRRRIGEEESLVAASEIVGTPWHFTAALPLHAALAPLASFRNAALVAASALVVLIGITAVLATRSVSTPLRELASAARRFGRGDPPGPLPRSGAVEVQQLVDAFRQMAADLERSRTEIEQLHQQDMERAQQLATVGEMASGIAHEVRNPLTGVLGALELAVRHLAAGSPAVSLLEEAQDQLKRIETTTTQLLRYARPPQLKRVVVDPNGLVERAARIVEPHAKRAGVHVALELVPPGLSVRVDPELMVQVLVNLMLNGIDASRSADTLAVSVVHRPPEVQMGIRDAGAGVPAEIQADIFRPFFTTKHQGTGLGLPISRQIVERHGGRLDLRAAPEGGAIFVVVLPQAAEEEP
jgi:signal transduction histidine kinase